jgi:hypothetical protein
VGKLIKDEYALNKITDKINDIKQEIKKNKQKTNPLFVQDVDHLG